jgi:hypothetical protein
MNSVPVALIKKERNDPEKLQKLQKLPFYLTKAEN